MVSAHSRDFDVLRIDVRVYGNFLDRKMLTSLLRPSEYPFFLDLLLSKRVLILYLLPGEVGTNSVKFFFFAVPITPPEPEGDWLFR